MPRKIQLLLGLALIGGFSAWLGLLLPSEGSNETIPILLAYPILAATLVVFVYTLRHSLQGIFKSVKADRLILAAALLSLLWLLSVEPFMFKIVHDEGLIASTAQSFHSERAAAVSGTGNWSQAYYETYEGFIDKRPLLLPFLVSLLHDLTGYRVENVFVVNGLLTGLLLLVMTGLMRTLTDRRGALLGLLLLTFLPVLAQGATSGNASILNGLMLASALALGLRYWERPDETTLPPLVYSLILLAHSRYESILYVIPFGLLILLGWRKAGRIVLTPLVIIAPLFLIFNVWHLRYAMAYESFYLQDGPDARDATFSFSYILANLRETLTFLFSFSESHLNSPLLSLCGLSGLGALIVGAAKKELAHRSRAAFAVLLAVALTNLAVILCFNFGVFTHYVTARLSLPLYLLLTLFAVLGFHHDRRLLFRIFTLLTALALVAHVTLFDNELGTESAVRFFMGMTVLVIGYALLASHAHRLKTLFPVALLLASVALIVPKMRSHPNLERYAPAIAAREIMQFVQEHQTRDTLFVTWNPIYPILLQANTVDPRRLPEAAELRQAVETGHYRHIYTLASVDPEKSNLPPLTVPEGFESVPVQKQRIAPGYFFEAAEWRLLPPSDRDSIPTQGTEPKPEPKPEPLPASLPATPPKPISMTKAGSETEAESESFDTLRAGPPPRGTAPKTAEGRSHS